MFPPTTETLESLWDHQQCVWTDHILMLGSYFPFCYHASNSNILIYNPQLLQFASTADSTLALHRPLVISERLQELFFFYMLIFINSSWLSGPKITRLNLIFSFSLFFLLKVQASLLLTKCRRHSILNTLLSSEFPCNPFMVS